jgi:hypothetical protein
MEGTWMRLVGWKFLDKNNEVPLWFVVSLSESKGSLRIAGQCFAFIK